jgi:LEA14-like dessication related protein
MKRALLVAAAVLSAGSGCATMGRQAFQQPIVNLRNVRVVGLGLTGGSVDVVLSVYNPNGNRLDATSLSYRVMIDSVQLGQGTLPQRFAVQDKDSTEVTIPVQFTYAGIGAAGRSILNTGVVNYRVLGDIVVGTVVGNFTVPFSQTGRFSTLAR